MNNPTDTNQASEDDLRESIDTLLERWRNILTYKGDGNGDEYYQSEVVDDIQEIIRTEKLKLLDELDKSMPTAEQLTTKYGYHMPEKQYGYKLALHDIREVLTKLEAEL